MESSRYGGMLNAARELRKKTVETAVPLQKQLLFIRVDAGKPTQFTVPYSIALATTANVVATADGQATISVLGKANFTPRYEFKIKQGTQEIEIPALDIPAGCSISIESTTDFGITLTILSRN